MSDVGSEAGLETLLHFLQLCPVGLVVCNGDGTVAFANPAVVRLIQPLVGGGRLDNLVRALAGPLPELREVLAAFPEPVGCVLAQRVIEVPGAADSSWHALTVIKVGEDRFVAVLRDVTQTTRQELRIRADHERFRAIVDHVRDYAICTLDREGHIEEWNRSLERVGGWRPGMVEGHPATMVVPPDNDAGDSAAERLAALARLLALARRQGSIEVEGWCVRADSSRFWANCVVTARPDATGEVQGYIVLTRDVSVRKQALDELRARAETDALTGLMNRSAFEALAAAALAARHPREPPIALLLMDADRFKQINDRYGHETGDAVLQHLAGVLLPVLRERDILARWGGEEFAVLLPDTGLDGAIAVAERLRAAVEANPAPISGGAVAVAASFGVAVAHDRQPLRDLLRRADAALYRAKAEGRNRVVAAD